MANHDLNTAVTDENLVASISRILLRSDIPCVLWGNYLLTVYGVPTIVNSIDFAVPDHLVAAAESALQNKGLADCSEPELCTAVAKTRTSPAPAAHFHIDFEMTVSIYMRSSTFWSLPSLDLEQLIRSHDIILASDSYLPPPRPGRGHGAFRASPFPVYIPTAHHLLEAFVRLAAGSYGGRYINWGIAMITYIEEFLEGDGLLDEELVEDRCRKFYSDMKLGERPLRPLLKELADSFGWSFD
ncbi:hypothetical protein VE02_05335 [Pseudogymnoascus sp. 03VT05]|nr:hypothetical protein VE02_05335 [Pseudogymnoascus sp. 03VT05]